jgi:hypothetical protein
MEAKSFYCVIERPDGTTYTQQYSIYSLNKSEQLRWIQKQLGPRSGRNAYWACDGWYDL